MNLMRLMILAFGSTLLLGAVAAAAAAEAAAAESAEPAESLVAPSSIAHLPDDRIALLVPAGAQTLLFVSRDPYPISLEDFGKPIVLFGEGGVLGKERPGGGVAIAPADKELRVVCGSGAKLICYSTPAAVGRDSTWQERSSDLAGRVTVEQAITDGRGKMLILYRETSQTSRPRNRLGAATLRDKKVATFPIAEGDEPFLSPRGTFVPDDNSVRVVWAESESKPVMICARINPSDGKVSELEPLGEGRRPSALQVGGRAFIASEQSDGSILAEWTTPGGSRQKQRLRGRAGLGPTLLADEHGVAWLLAVGSDRRAMYYRRFLGDGFGPESECNPAPGTWTLSRSFAAHAINGPSRASVAVLEAKFAKETGEYQYIFANLPVPRYAVADSRRVLFLDMLEVAELKNLRQKVTTAVRYDDNPLKLNGPPGWYDCAYAGYANVMVEGGKFRMWYNGRSDEVTPDRNFVSCYAESTDGVNWTKPQLGLYEFKGSKQNNLIFPFESGACEPIVIRDEQETDPARRYKMVLEATHEGPTGVYLSWSADGIVWHWPPHRLWGKSPGKNQTTKGFHPWHEPLLSFFRDPLEKNENYRWKMYGQNVYAGFPHVETNRRRNLSLVHSATPYEFTAFVDNPLLDPRTGVEEDQIHGGLVQPYEGMYVCLYQHWWDQDWKVDLRLAASRDGVHFVRVQPQAAVLPLGPDGAWDSGMLCTPNVLFERDGKLWLYYRGSVGTLATGRAIGKAKDLPQAETRDSWRMMTGLAKLRVDGFAFLTLAPMEYLPQPPRTTEVPDYRLSTLGTLTTIPIDATGIAGRSLHVNVDNLAPGFAWLKAQLRDADSGQVIDGYRFDDCDALNEGALAHRFSWRGSPKLDGVRAQRIRVEFQLHGALDAPQLYSFWFADVPGRRQG